MKRTETFFTFFYAWPVLARLSSPPISHHVLPAPSLLSFIRSVSSSSTDISVRCSSYQTTSQNVYFQQCFGGFLIFISKLRDSIQQFLSLCPLDAHGSEVDHRLRLLQPPVHPLVFAPNSVVLIVSLPSALGKGIRTLAAH